MHIVFLLYLSIYVPVLRKNDLYETLHMLGIHEQPTKKHKKYTDAKDILLCFVLMTFMYLYSFVIN